RWRQQGARASGEEVCRSARSSGRQSLIWLYVTNPLCLPNGIDGGRRNALVSNYSGGGGAVDRGFNPAAAWEEGTRANLSLPMQTLPPEIEVSRGEARAADHVPALFADLYCSFGDERRHSP